ncbi:MAG TPA: class I SAM-dependent methyltransferase [Steroidobacteraceae bacterium]|nr:class I SAM-dependent methyltransferase [Steroidobacteraceae bacterium]
MELANTQAPVAVATPAAFDADYAQWKAWDFAAFGRYSYIDAAYYAAEFGIGEAAGKRVLEIGFGNGSALGWLKDQGSETHGIEANPILVEQAQRLLGAHRAFEDLRDARLAPGFDHIIALDVLEHVPMDALPAMLARIRDLLAPGGQALFRFPNGDSPFGRVNQHGDPTHITVLGGARITWFARRAGLEVQSLRAPALPIRGVGSLRGLRRLGIRIARGMIEPVIGQLYFNGRRLPLDPNYVAVLTLPLGKRHRPAT